MLFLDYDGTLAPFVQERSQAFPYPGVRECLHSIQTDTPTNVVLISGRPAADVLTLLGLEIQPEIWGSHGLERLLSDGLLLRTPLDSLVSEALEKAVSWAAREGLSALVEKKYGCVAFHWRGLEQKASKELKAKVFPVLSSLASGTRTEVRNFDGGLELRASGFNKGDAVKTILDELGGSCAAAYLGDDLTDEDAFKLMGANEKGLGIGVLVRPERRETKADVWLRPPGELLAFLCKWKECVNSRDKVLSDVC